MTFQARNIFNISVTYIASSSNMECDCEEVTSCEGISRPTVQKKRAKDVPKVSKVTETTKIEPLFSLPPELMECIKCKKLQEKRKQSKFEDTYTGKRLKVENFRRSAFEFLSNFLKL